MLSSIAGIALFRSVMVPEFSTRANRSLPLKKWHKRSRSNYRDRVNKKWVKRFGTKTERTIVQIAQGLFVHPNTFTYLENNIEKFKL